MRYLFLSAAFVVLAALAAAFGGYFKCEPSCPCGCASTGTCDCGE